MLESDQTAENTGNDPLIDEEILARSVNDPELFAALLDRYQEAFLRKAFSIVRNREEAEDVAQEAFTKIYLNAARFRVQPGASFKSWAYRILINTALTHYQKQKRTARATAHLSPEFYEMLPDTKSRFSEKQELSDYVVSILSRMPEHFRSVLSLHFLEGLSQWEIAKRQGTSLCAVKTRVHRAKKEFKRICATLA